MEETYQLTSALKYIPWGETVAIVTDARFSGVSTGACIGHVGPEALAGGPIGKLVDGDVIEIVIDRRALSGRVDLVATAGGPAHRGRGVALLARTPAASRPARPPRASGRHAALGGAAAGERRHVGGLRLRRGSHHRRDQGRTRGAFVSALGGHLPHECGRGGPRRRD